MALRYEQPKMTFATKRGDVSIIAVFLKEDQVVSVDSILFYNNASVANSGYAYSKDSDHICINMHGAYQSGYHDVLIFTHHEYRKGDSNVVLELIKNGVEPSELASARSLSMKTIRSDVSALSLDYHLSLDKYYRKTSACLLHTPTWSFSLKRIKSSIALLIH
ncbi:hypothetical protein LMH73_015965 [Vibrio splendidus]